MNSKFWSRSVRLGMVGAGSAATISTSAFAHTLNSKTSASSFYSEWSGHRIDHLYQLCKHFRQQRANNSQAKGFLIYLAGDSSLDNKHWVQSSQREALNGYEDILDPPQMAADVAYHMNREAEERLGKKGAVVTINAAVEESMLRDRQKVLLEQDRFIMNTISPDDVLVVSIGGNDIALNPTVSTVTNMMKLITLNSAEGIEKGNGWGFNHFVNLFGTEVERYLNELTKLNKPKLIVVCMIYYPEEEANPSWAGNSLAGLGYNKEPKKLQAAIKQMFEHATKKINIPGTTIVPVPLFQVMDGKNAADYVARVEPSDLGGQKMSKLIWDNIQTALETSKTSA